VSPPPKALNQPIVVVKLPSFRPDANVAIIGASGGIGRALCHALAGGYSPRTVHALSRNPDSFDDHSICSSKIDLLDETSIADAAEQLGKAGELDLIIVTTGILHQGDLQPEKTMREICGASMLDVLQVNTVGPALVAKHFLPIMRRKDKSVFAALSARVGSISDNRLGGWVSYRASKAALNMTIKTLAIEHARRCPDSAVVALHPGTVETALSEPFRSRVPPAKLFEPDEAVAHLLRVIDNVSRTDTGAFLAWDGSQIPF
jgi:NAD(P)-dependent dehydrogenase (short-subunit alcohol dehydrogenase family)